MLYAQFMLYYILEISTTKFILFDNEFGLEGEGSTPIGSFSPRETIGVITKGNLQKLLKSVNQIQESDKKAEFIYIKKMGNMVRAIPGLPPKIKFLTKENKKS
jgi:hypothetical protein